ncbi:MAG: mechanosensitive ion channel domain-containing protein [Bythopirellula sp.]
MNPSRPIFRFMLSAAFALVFTIAGVQTQAVAQVPSLLRPDDSTATDPPKKVERTLAEWQADVEKRLTAAEAEAVQDEQAEKAPSAALKRRLEILARLDLILTQLADERDEANKLEQNRENLQGELDTLVQSGLDDDEATSLRQLDLVREELLTEERRLQRIADKARAAATALDKAQEDLADKNVARRLANEKAEDNEEDNLRQTLGEQLAEVVERSELAKAIASLRRQELLNAKADKEIQQLKVRELKERDARLAAAVEFGPRELNELYGELDRKEDELKQRIAKLDREAELRIRGVEEQWITARRKFDASADNKPQLNEQISAFELEYQVLKETPPLLRLQLDLLNRDRQAWRYRQRIFNGAPDRKTVLNWIEASNEALTQIKREERRVSFEIDELREQLGVVEDKLEKDEQTLEAVAIKQQLASLQSLLEFHEECLDSIRTSLRLHERLIGELEGDSLAATAKDKLHTLWNGVEAIWTYELTAFGDKENERSVTVQKVVTALMVLLAGMIFSNALSRALGRQVLRRLDIDPSASATIQSLFYYVLLLLFGLFALNVAKVPLTAFTVLGGAVALGIGFGSQNIINNFISGLILLAERPVKVGDLIQLEGGPSGEQLYGNIEHIGARSTRVRTGANLEIIVPNSAFLQNNVINFTLSSDKVRTMVEVGVIYGSPTVTVTQLLRRAVIETGRVAKDPPPIILFKSFGDNSLLFEVHFWIRMRAMMDKLQIESAVRFRIDQLFREEGIVIAFPQRDVHLDTKSPITIQMVDNTTDSTP